MFGYPLALFLCNAGMVAGGMLIYRGSRNRQLTPEMRISRALLGMYIVGISVALEGCLPALLHLGIEDRVTLAAFYCLAGSGLALLLTVLVLYIRWFVLRIGGPNANPPHQNYAQAKVAVALSLGVAIRVRVLD